MGTALIQAEYQSLIFEIRGYKVMIDTDLAALYETETKVLKQQVKRNNDRFPKDFMFVLTKEEKNQLVTNCDRLSNLKHSIIRSNGKGIIVFYDYQGNALAKTNTFISNSKINYAEIPIQSTTTVYSMVGNIFVYILILFLLVFLGLRISKKEEISEAS